ncbi:MAG: hypothetical protein KDJ73_10820 [Notoacmeibacter sp.]|nr:hypothetical protein [Notoacmeibacter sp.]MCC0033287.1 hypothetical protein [Brucellaceae bacterium]
MKTLFATLGILAAAAVPATACPYSNKSAALDQTATASISQPGTPLSAPAEAAPAEDETDPAAVKPVSVEDAG